MPYRFNRFLFIACAAFLMHPLSACKGGSHLAKQEHTTNDTLSNYPYWIEMMDNPNVNYYKAVEAFDKYWEHRERPTEDDGEGKDIYGKEKSKEEKEKEANRSIQYVYEYKQFLNWQQRNKNLVKPDGSIMSPEEIIEQWKKSQIDTLKR
jgi:hypothetical protein